MLETLQLNAMLTSVLVFAAAFLAIFAVNALVAEVGRRGAVSAKQRLDREFNTASRERARSVLHKNYLQHAHRAVDDPDHKPGLFESAQLWLEQASLTIRLVPFLIMVAIVALVTLVLAYVATSSLVLAPVLAAIAAAVPFLNVELRRKKRLKQLREQLPDAFDLMARVMRSGQTVSQALQAVSEEFSMPISGEFGYCYEQMNLGLPPDTAMRDLAQRTGVLEIRIFVLAVIVHRQSGGNLSELLEKLSTVVRDRFRIRGMIDSLTAQGRLQAAILLSLPPGMFVLMAVMRPEYELMLLDYPWMIAAALISMAVGALWIRSIVNFDY